MHPLELCFLTLKYQHNVRRKKLVSNSFDERDSEKKTHTRRDANNTTVTQTAHWILYQIEPHISK